jgi:ketosteroid isomerase-like protein
MLTLSRTARRLVALAATLTIAACATIRSNEGSPMIQHATTDREYQLVQTRLSQAYQDMAAGSIDRLMLLYATDAIIQSPREAPVAGTAAIRAFWLGTFERYRVELTPEVQEVTTVADAVVVRGRATGTLTSRAGEPAVHVDTWFMQVYRTQPDGTLLFWRGANGPNP